MRKIQKKYYLSEEVSRLVRIASAKSGISQSQIVEACLTLDLVRRAARKP